MENQRNCITQAATMTTLISLKNQWKINEIANSGRRPMLAAILDDFDGKPLVNQRNRYSQAAGLPPPKNSFREGPV
jgi:hypothetical protein